MIVVVSAWILSVYFEKAHKKMNWHLPSSPWRDGLLEGKGPLGADDPQLMKRKSWFFGWEGAGARHSVSGPKIDTCDASLGRVSSAGALFLNRLILMLVSLMCIYPPVFAVIRAASQIMGLLNTGGGEAVEIKVSRRPGLRSLWRPFRLPFSDSGSTMESNHSEARFLREAGEEGLEGDSQAMLSNKMTTHSFLHLSSLKCNNIKIQSFSYIGIHISV